MFARLGVNSRRRREEERVKRDYGRKKELFLHFYRYNMFNRNDLWQFLFLQHLGIVDSAVLNDSVDDLETFLAKFTSGDIISNSVHESWMSYYSKYCHNPNYCL